MNWKMRNQSGQSLVEVAISAALVGLSAIAVMEFVSIDSSMMGSSSRVSEFAGLMDQVRTLVATEQGCRIALGGPATYNGTPNSRAQALGALLYPGHPVYNPIIIYSPLMPGNGPWLCDPAAAGGSCPTTYYTALAGTTGGAWKVQRLALMPDQGVVNTDGVYAMDLVVSVTAVGSGTLNPMNAMTNNGTIRLAVKVDSSNTIVSCGPLSYGTDMNIVPICGPDQALKSDGTRLFCINIRCQTTAGGNQMVQYGNDAFGGVECCDPNAPAQCPP